MQESARSDYQLTNYARLLGGTQLTLPPVGTGSAYVTGTSEGFTVSPEAALAQYITMLNSGTQDTSQFVADEFTKSYFSIIEDLNSSVSAAGSVTPAATASDYPISGLVLQDGSALVAANFKYTLTYQRTVAGATMSLGGNTAEPVGSNRGRQCRGQLPGHRHHAHPFQERGRNHSDRRRRTLHRLGHAGSVQQSRLSFTLSAQFVPVAWRRGDDAYHRHVHT